MFVGGGGRGGKGVGAEEVMVSNNKLQPIRHFFQRFINQKRGDNLKY